MMRYQRIEAKANKLLRNAGVHEAPVDLEQLAEHLDIQIQYEDLDDDVSGFLAVNPEKAVAVINSNQHPNRQRFTIAHEIGHYCLHVENGSRDKLFIDKKYAVHHRNRESSLGTVSSEREANLFASVLLMPRHLIECAIKEQGLDFFDDTDTFALSKKFGVSEQALGFRLARLNFEVGD